MPDEREGERRHQKGSFHDRSGVLEKILHSELEYRPSAADVIRPKVGVPIAPPGLLKRAWLKTLNPSNRSWTRRDPPALMFLMSARSDELNPGP